MGAGSGVLLNIGGKHIFRLARESAQIDYQLAHRRIAFRRFFSKAFSTMLRSGVGTLAGTGSGLA